MEFYIGLAVLFLGSIGSLWYKMGRVEAEVKHHNRMLKEVQKSLEKLMVRSR